MTREPVGGSETPVSEWVYPPVKDHDIPDELVEKWQQLLDITAEIFQVPAGLIMRIDPPYIEVFQASENPENPYGVGSREEIFGLYCEEVVLTREGMHVPDAQKSDRWRDNQDVEEFGFIAYLGYPIEWPDGEVFGTICVLDEEEREFVGFYRDLLQQFRNMVEVDLKVISQQRELEAKNEHLEEFAGIVSHDLRNPLSVAEGYMELAEADCDSEHLAVVKRAHQRMHTMIDDLLTLARDEYRVIERETVELREIAETAWQNVSVRDATLQVEGDRLLRASPTRLAHMFENLYRNAIEHGGDGVRITVGPLEDGFYVEDDGLGIDEADREHVFTPGYSQSAAGTGFGLAIVAGVATAHNWVVELTEGADGGVRVEFTGVE